MSNVSANIGANTQQAESSIGRLLASLRKLRQESSTGVGMKMFASDEVNKLSTALNQAIAAAGALNKLDLSQFDQSLRRSAELLKRNADNYLRAQQAMGNQGVAGRFAQQLGAGGNPLNPNFSQMFPGMQGAALQRQMDYYFKSMLRGTGMSGGYSGGGGFARSGERGGTTGQGGGSGRSEATENEGVFSGGAAGMLAGVGKLLGPLVAAIGVGKLASASLASARGNTEAEDTLMRMTRDTGAAAGKLADDFIAAGLKVGLSATEAMKTAQVFASAAQEIDRGKAMTGATTSAGFARAYGMNINGTTETLGGLQRAGVVGTNEVVQNSFLMKMAQVIKDTGMSANADQVLSDLAQTVDRYISHDSATPDQGKLDAFTSLRAATYMTPGLSGQHGQNLLNRYDENMRSDSNDARNVMMATALQEYGINNLYTQQAVQAEGANFDLSSLPGWKGPKGMTYGELAATKAHQIAYGSIGPATGDPQGDVDRRNQAKVYQANLLNEAIPGAEKPWELYQQMAVDRESMTRHQGELKRYGLGMGDFKGTGGFKDVLDLLETDDQDGIRKIAKRYASELDITDEAQLASREHLDKFLEDPGSSSEDIKKATLQAMAKHGQHGTMATDDRTKDAMVDNALANTGKVFLSEWNKFLMIGAKALDGFAEVSGDLVESFEDSLIPSVMALSREAMNAAGYLKEIYRGESEYSLLEREGALDEQGNLLPSASPEQQARYAAMKQRQQSSMGGTPGGPTVTAGVLPDGSPTTVDAAVAAGIGGDPKDYPEPGTRAWDDWLEGLEKDLKLPAGIMAGTEAVETGHLPNEDQDTAVSPAGAKGRFQLMPAAIADRGVHDPSNPHQNAIGGALHHAWAAQQMRNKNIAPTAQRMAAAYNTGTGRIINQNGNYTNKDYVQKVMRHVAKPEDANGDMAAAVNNAEVMDRAKDRVDLSQKNMCATYATTVGQEAGLDIPVIPGAQNAANYLEDKLGWQRYPLEEAKAGHLLVARDDDKKIPGADHVAWMQQDYDPNNPDTVQVVDNQNPLGGTRDVTGKPGPNQKTPPQYFLGPPESGGKAFKRFVDKHTPKTPANTGGQAAANIPPPPAPNITPTNVPADTGSPAGEAPADTGAATPSAPTEAAATATADTGATQPDVPADTGAAAGKGGKSAVPGVDVPKLEDVAPTVTTLSPEAAAEKAAKDAEAQRMQGSTRDTSAGVKEFERKAAEAAAKQKDAGAPDAEAAAAKARAQQGLPPLPKNDRPDFNTGAPKPDDIDAINRERALKGLPNLPKPDATLRGGAPGDQQVDADANKVVAASNSSTFSGSVDVNVHNHNSKGERTESNKTTLKAGSGGTDNIPKGVVTIGTAPAAPQ